MSSSPLWGYGSSREVWNEADLEPVEPGVPGSPEPLRRDGSGFCRNLCDNEKISPKLLRPTVEVEFLSDGVNSGGDSWVSCSADSPIEPSVEDLPRRPVRDGGTWRDGVDAPDRWDTVDSFPNTAGPEDPCGAFVKAAVEWVGEGIGDGCPRDWAPCSPAAALF